MSIHADSHSWQSGQINDNFLGATNIDSSTPGFLSGDLEHASAVPHAVLRTTQTLQSLNSTFLTYGGPQKTLLSAKAATFPGNGLFDMYSRDGAFSKAPSSMLAPIPANLSALPLLPATALDTPSTSSLTLSSTSSVIRMQPLGCKNVNKYTRTAEEREKKRLRTKLSAMGGDAESRVRVFCFEDWSPPTKERRTPAQRMQSREVRSAGGACRLCWLMKKPVGIQCLASSLLSG